jgi:hypothetical protein
VNLTSLRLPCVSWKVEILPARVGFVRPFFSYVGKRSHAMFVPCIAARSNEGQAVHHAIRSEQFCSDPASRLT